MTMPVSCRVVLISAMVLSVTASGRTAGEQGQEPQPCLTCIGSASAEQLNAQREVASAREAAAARQVIPLQFQVVLAKFQGDKKISSTPYTLTLNTGGTNSLTANTTSSVRMGTQVAVPVTSTYEGKTTTSYEYRDIGTSIDCGAIARPDGAFNVTITVSDSAVYPDDQPKTAPVGQLPVIRSFRSTNRLLLRDGQTSQFTAATDRVSGEVVKIDVTLKVLK